MIFLGFLIVLVLYGLSILVAGGSFPAFWDIWALGTVFLGVTFHVACFGAEYFLPGLKTIFRAPRPEHGEMDRKLGQYYRRLTGFTLGLGTVVMFLGLLLSNSPYQSPEVIGFSLAISLLVFTYATGMALTIFWPISLRHLPDSVDMKKFPIGFTLAGFASFFIARALMITLLVALMANSGLIQTKSGLLQGETDRMRMKDAGMMIIKQTFLNLNPADLHEDFRQYSVRWFWDTPSILMLYCCLGAFRLASGRIHNRWTWTPVCILYGVFGVVLGMVVMLGNMDPKTYATGCGVCLLSAFYGILAAIFFAAGGTWRLLTMLFLGCLSLVLPILIIDGIATIGVTTIADVIGFLIASFIFIFVATLFLYLLWGSFKKISPAGPQEPSPQSQPLAPEEKQARQILDNAIEEGKSRT